MKSRWVHRQPTTITLVSFRRPSVQSSWHRHRASLVASSVHSATSSAVSRPALTRAHLHSTAHSTVRRSCHRRSAQSPPWRPSCPLLNCRPFRQLYRLKWLNPIRPMFANTDPFTTPTIMPPVKWGLVLLTDGPHRPLPFTNRRIIIRIRILSPMRLSTHERSKILTIIHRGKLIDSNSKAIIRNDALNETLIYFLLCEYVSSFSLSLSFDYNYNQSLTNHVSNQCLNTHRILLEIRVFILFVGPFFLV